MDLPMNQDKFKNLIASIPTEQLKSDEIEPFIQQMRKHLIEKALQGEMDAHLGYDRYERHSGTNSRNGSSKKALKTEKGPISKRSRWQFRTTNRPQGTNANGRAR